MADETAVNYPTDTVSAPGFLRGFQQVLGNRVLEAHEDERAQQKMEREHYWNVMHDPSLGYDPSDPPEEQQRKQVLLNHATQEFQKRMPKAMKPIMQYVTPILQKIHGHDKMQGGGGGQEQAPGQAPQGAQRPAAISPPPAEQQAAPQAAPQVSLPAAPQATAQTEAPARTAAIPPPPSGADIALGSQKFQEKHKAALQGAEAENSAMAQVHGQQALAEWQPQKVQEYQDFIDSLPEDKQAQAAMMLGVYPKAMLGWMKDQIKLVPDDPNNPSAGAHYTGISPLETMQGKTLPGFLPGSMVGRESVHKDVFGNVDTTTRTPIAPGGGRPGKGAASARPTAIPNATPGQGTPRAIPNAVSNRVLTHTPPPLDAEGHIPIVQGANPQVIENANQLLDGQDITKLPLKARTPSAALARKYGWEQGKFTPKEQTQIREAATFIDEAIGNKAALGALDDSAIDRAQLAQLTRNPEKLGTIGTAVTSYLAQGMSPKQAEFLRMYNQLVGTISGLSKLVRPGSTTEAQIERLKSELPNPVTSKSSTDAMARLRRLRKEIDVALVKGNFGGDTNVSRPAAVTAPPSGSSSIDDEIMKAVNGK